MFMNSKTDLLDPAKTTGLAESSGASSSDTAIDQIREILFGAQLKSINDRFIQVENMLLSHNTRLLNLLNKRVDVLQEMIESRNTLLEASIASEREQRLQSLQKLDDQLREQGRRLQQDFDELSTQTAEEMTRLRAAVSQETEDLRQGFDAHETGLAELFHEMADKLLTSVKK